MQVLPIPGGAPQPVSGAGHVGPGVVKRCEIAEVFVLDHELRPLPAGEFPDPGDGVEMLFEGVDAAEQRLVLELVLDAEV